MKQESKKDLALKIFIRSFQWLIIVLAWILYIAILLSILLIPYAMIIVPLVWVVILVIVKLQHLRFISLIQGNTIVHGGRGKGKGLLFDMALSYEAKAISNIEYGNNVDIIEPRKYFGSIAPNTALTFLQGKITKISKHNEWERLPYYLDDGALYFPNYNDAEIKKLYPNITLFLPIQRHLYDTYTVINAQNIERLFKPLRELQDDGYIKALKTVGKGYIWRHLPILRKYFIVNYRYHDNLDSALANRLPFSKLGLINQATGPLITSTPEALKKQYEATNGVIIDGFIVRKKTDIKYDTRYFHNEFFKDESEENPLDTIKKDNPLDVKQSNPLENEQKGL